MTPEERERSERIDRLLEFLANNQAQLTAQEAKLSADLDRLKQVVDVHSTQIADLGNFILRIGRVVEEQGRHFERLVEEQGRHSERFFTGVDESLKRLAEAQEQTDARLNALITVVERYFSNGRH